MGKNIYKCTRTRPNAVLSPDGSPTKPVGPLPLTLLPLKITGDRRRLRQRIAVKRHVHCTT